MNNLQKEFEKYAVMHMGIDEMHIQNWQALQNTIYSNVQTFGGMTPQGSMTPYILEEREMRVTQMDIFSRLMMERILWVAGAVNDQMSTVVQAQLMFLDNVDPHKPITMHVDSPGGSVKSGLSMVDVMNYINAEVHTINTGMAASMGSILLGAGEKGKRATLPSSKVMLHQVSAGAQGHVKDMEITMAEAKKYNDKLFGMLADYCGKDVAEILADCERDNWLTAEEAKEYGIVDEIVTKRVIG